MERPNTVAGLIEKRRELVARRKLAEADIKGFTSGIDAIDIVLKLFGSEIDTANAKPRRLPIPHAAGRGEMRRNALELLRETGAPITSRMIAERFCEKRGLHVDDASFKKIHYRASQATRYLRNKGLIRQGGKDGMHVQWVAT
jgi:hypothetical protein